MFGLFSQLQDQLELWITEHLFNICLKKYDLE